MKSKCGAALLLMLVLVMACAGALAADPYTVTFSATLPDGSSPTGSPADQIIEANNTVKEPQAPSAVGYTFEGWYKENTFETKYNFTDGVTVNFTEQVHSEV